MTSEMLYNYVTCFKNAFSISGDLRLSCVQISLISDTGPILAIREPCPFQVKITLVCIFILLINVKMPPIVGKFTFMSRINFMLS